MVTNPEFLVVVVKSEGIHSPVNASTLILTVLIGLVVVAQLADTPSAHEVREMLTNVSRPIEAVPAVSGRRSGEPRGHPYHSSAGTPDSRLSVPRWDPPHRPGGQERRCRAPDF